MDIYQKKCTNVQELYKKVLNITDFQRNIV